MFTVTGMLVVALAVTGCGLTGEDQEAEQASEQVPTESAAGEESTDSEESGDEGEEAEQQDGPLATRRGQIDGEAVILEITELERSGDTTALNIRVGVPGETESSIGAQVAQTFDDGVGALEDEEGDTSTLDGISLIDNQNRKRYLVARDSEGTCVCDGNLGSAFVEANAPVSLSATFGAPSDDVDSVDVAIPQFGTFKDVPLS